MILANPDLKMGAGTARALSPRALSQWEAVLTEQILRSAQRTLDRSYNKLKALKQPFESPS